VKIIPLMWVLFSVLFITSIAYAGECKHYRHIYHHKCQHCNFSIHYISVLPACGCNRAWTVVYPASGDVVTFSARPPRHDGKYVEDENANYDPDMSTGDDNAVVHPGMDIDY